MAGTQYKNATSGEYVEASTASGLPVAASSATYSRLYGGAVATHSAVIAADAAVVSGPCIFYGVKVVTAGTNVTVYDGVTAAGVAVITTEATASAGALITPAGAGVGVLMTTGIYLDLTLGTYIVYYAR